MAKVLLLQNALDLDYRQLEGYLHPAPKLCRRTGLCRPPSRNTTLSALRRFPELWLHEFNDAVLAGFKEGGPTSPSSSRRGLDGASAETGNRVSPLNR
jgi:hypothetical protein